MFEVLHLELEDLVPLLNEPINAHLKYWADNDYLYAKHVIQNSMALTCCVDREPMVCAFVIHLWAGRGYLVTVFSEKVKNHSAAVYRGLKNFIPKLPFNRLEFDCPIGLEIAHKRAKFLGFKLMCEHARKYMPNGDDASVYEWVRA